ncbi:hypothetical protein L6164_018017 [Bauhinia variegata]|uniref:Uncharacterized protein n=1 Tax=Bauhinia variegata TaxID=167791 RepID=A0ACB9N9X4_BAUVA|nr:hypothetical protein L6164_018017 [Bauhinia variegata]
MVVSGKAAFLLCLLSLATTLLAGTETVQPSNYTVPFNRSSFPAGFVFGAGSAAYQTEGAATVDGRGPSIWDTFTKQHPEKILDGSNGDVAEDVYHKYKDDIKLMKEIGLDSFRFSISWPRIFPNGKGKVNDLGVKFYNNLINELLSKRLTPFVTIFHWDVPQALEDEYGGFLSPKIVPDYRDYAEFCFKTFGDRVKNWVTLNEPFIFSVNGYNNGTLAPGRCSNHVGNCTAGNSATEPYIVGHNLLLAHAAAVRVYRAKYQGYQKGQIGITLVTHWFVPKSNSTASLEASSRTLEHYFGWFAHPITYGDYPQGMKSSIGDRLPKFTQVQSQLLRGSYDFLGVNYYTAYYAEYSYFTSGVNGSYYADIQTTITSVKNGVSLGTATALSWLYIYPEGLQQLLVHIKEKYNNPPIYITENGVAEAKNDSKPIEEALKDGIRIQYHDSHLKSLLEAIKNGVNVKGYYIWSFLDDFEWGSGYTVRFGLVYVDFKNLLTRYLKSSAYWLKNFLLK